MLVGADEPSPGSFEAAPAPPTAALPHPAPPSVWSYTDPLSACTPLALTLAFTLTPLTQLGAEKPNPRVFEAACAALGLPPESCVHVGDDRRNDLYGARDAGCVAWLWGQDVHDFRWGWEGLGGAPGSVESRGWVQRSGLGVGCSGTLPCGGTPVLAQEVREGESPGGGGGRMWGQDLKWAGGGEGAGLGTHGLGGGGGGSQAALVLCGSVRVEEQCGP